MFISIKVVQWTQRGFIYFFQMDPEFEPHNVETRTLFGLKLEQQRNNAKIDDSVFKNVVTLRQDVSDKNTSFPPH